MMIIEKSVTNQKETNAKQPTIDDDDDDRIECEKESEREKK